MRLSGQVNHEEWHGQAGQGGATPRRRERELLRSSSSDKKRAENFPENAANASPTYRLAYADPDLSPGTAVRAPSQLELAKADMTLVPEHQYSRSTVARFSVARAFRAPGAEGGLPRTPCRPILEGVSP